MFLIYIKELLRPKRLIAVYRNYNQLMAFKKVKLKIGFYSKIQNVIFERKVYIGSHCLIVNTNIGKHTYVNDKTSIRNTIIGNYTSIGSNVSIGIGSHPTNLVSTHPAFYSNNKAFNTFAKKNYVHEYGKCNIGNDVWIGSNVTILNNINVGDGAIIAFGAVVTKDIEPYSIVGGVPAKHIKYRIDESLRTKVALTKWWDSETAFLAENYKIFHDVEEFSKNYFECLKHFKSR